MAIREHIEVVLKGAKEIARWREANPDICLDLSGANLRRAELIRANLNDAILSGANLEWADLGWSDLMRTDLSRTHLSRTDFHKADLTKANFTLANLADANFEDANCQGAKFDFSMFVSTRLLNTDFRGADGLEKANHAGPSILDSETIEKSGNLPLCFLRGCGLSDQAIKASYFDNAVKLKENIDIEGDYYSCFISYSSKDQVFTNKLHDDLQNSGVRCWIDVKDMRTGDIIIDAVYKAIRQKEKLLLILSKHSVQSDWVRDEILKAFDEERDRGGDLIIFPIRIDDAVMKSDKAWAQKIRTRHIEDFREWENKEKYGNSFTRLLKDLKK